MLRRLDHAGIFLMIAGSYTPFTTHNLTGAWAWGMTVAVWSIAGIGALGKLLRPRSTASSGWPLPGAGLAGGGGAQADDRQRHLGRAAAAGGGRRALFHRRDLYVNKRLKFARAIWHGHVVAAAAAHWAAVLVGVWRSPRANIRCSALSGG